MINNMLIQIMIFKWFTYTCVFIDVPTDVWVEDVFKILVGVFIITVPDDVMIDTLSGVCIDLTIDVVSDIGVEVLTDVNANAVVETMSVL